MADPPVSFRRRPDLACSPAELTTRLAHLPGFMFFDSSGYPPHQSEPQISLLTGAPEQVFEGDISSASDRRPLQSYLENNHQPAPAHLPPGGLFGWIDYHGRFSFKATFQVAVYHHETKTWWEHGDWLDLAQKEPKKATLPPLHTERWQVSQSDADFLDAVARARDYIAAGDIYQVNLSRRFSHPFPATPADLFPLYQQLRGQTPAPMSAFLNLGDTTILSSSPETFLRLDQRQLETRPIKGTRPRIPHDPAADQKMAAELVSSEKERAELIMITDLLRNDLGQVADFGTVQVPHLLQLEPLEHVHHLVSTVTARLRHKTTHLETLAACLPGGSITGAPKKRACEIIAELEPAPRGPYTGIAGYLGNNGHSQFNILIRSLYHQKDILAYHVGAGIVADSDPTAELAETELKAQGIRQALRQTD